MAKMLDVARYITEISGTLSSMKLQKLMYYSQAWHMVWAEKPLFGDDFEAWANGPVCPALYAHHRGLFEVAAGSIPGNSALLEATEKAAVEKVLEFYGAQTAQWLSNLTHQERPWLETRGDLAPGDSSKAVISKALMHEYYTSL